MGVDIFLFMSGICLYFSFTKNLDVLMFIKKRITRILYPLCLTSVLLWIKYLVIHKITIWGFFNRIFLVQYWISDDLQVWFASLIVVLYILYPYIYYFIFEKKINTSIFVRTIALIVAVIIVTIAIKEETPKYFENVSHAITRVPVFLTGCCVGKFVYEKKRLPAWMLWGIIVFFAVAFVYTQKNGLFHGLIARYIYWVGGVAVALFLPIMLQNVPKWFKTVWSKWGILSLEIYLTHIVIRKELHTPFIEKQLGLSSWSKIIIVFAGAFVWAKLVSKCVDVIREKMSDGTLW